MMGFDMDVAEYAGVKVNYRSLEAIIEFLSKGDDGLYGHEFVEMQSELCYVCKEVRSVHRNKADEGSSLMPPGMSLNLIKQRSASIA